MRKRTEKAIQALRCSEDERAEIQKRIDAGDQQARFAMNAAAGRTENGTRYGAMFADWAARNAEALETKGE